MLWDIVFRDINNKKRKQYKILNIIIKYVDGGNIETTIKGNKPKNIYIFHRKHLFFGECTN